MEKKKTVSMAAIISIEPDLIKMCISKLKDNELVNIDKLERQIKIGHEIFNDKKISFESLREISGILKNYSQVLTEYGIKNYVVIATTLLNEAQNCAYIVDQIKIQNNMEVKVLEDRQEKSLIYFDIINILENFKYMPLDNTLLAYVDAGSIGFSIYNKNKIIFSQNINVGSSKLYEILDSVQDQTTEFSLVIEEYLNRILGRIEFPIGKTEIENLVITSNEIDLIAKLCKAKNNNNIYNINFKNINKLYGEIKNLTIDAISDKYDISIKNAQILFTSLAIYSKIFTMTSAQKSLSPKVELWSSIIKQVLSPKLEKKYEEHVIINSICCAEVLSRHFYFSRFHLEATFQYANLIFDKLRKIHGLNKRKKLLLDLAIILHEAGYYMNSKDPRISTFDIIKNLDLYGLTDKEIMLIANIVRYNEFTRPSKEDPEYIKLSQKEQLIISKMVAIFRLSNALDKSKKQKLRNVNVKISENNIIITSECTDNTCLERWALNKCSEFFQEVFGLKVKLIVKNNLL